MTTKRRNITILLLIASIAISVAIGLGIGLGIAKLDIRLASVELQQRHVGVSADLKGARLDSLQNVGLEAPDLNGTLEVASVALPLEGRGELKTLLGRDLNGSLEVASVLPLEARADPGRLQTLDVASARLVPNTLTV